MNHRYPILVFLCLLLTICPSLAIITVTPVDVGQTYIEWQWAPGMTATSILIDGISKCGYDMDANTYLITGLNPDELHTITVITDTDTGTNTTNTTPSASGSSSAQNVMVANELPLNPLIPIIATIAAVFLCWRRVNRM